MLWITGTSVSIEDGGYATRLAHRVQAELGVAHVNLSVGDQTSLMGCMRVLDQRHRIAPGDVVIWEYSLLDTLLTESEFPAEDVHHARRLAWDCLLQRGARILVVMTPSQRHLARRSLHEAQIAADARTLGLGCLDVRELIAALGLDDPALHYRDDRHPRLDSPIIEAMVRHIFDYVATHHGRALAGSARGHAARQRWRAGGGWRWLDAAALARGAATDTQTFSNSLLTIEAVSLPVDARIGLPDAARIVGVGIVSTHASGGLWCGHPGCAPAATRLPSELGYAFLLRSTALPCVRARVDALAAAPHWAYGCGLWAAYGQALCNEPGPVAVFGVLYEPARRDATRLAGLKALLAPAKHGDRRADASATLVSRARRRLAALARRLLG